MTPLPSPGGRLSGDVFSRLEPERFQESFMQWSQGEAELLPGEVVAIDGNTAPRSCDRHGGKRALHLQRGRTPGTQGLRPAEHLHPPKYIPGYAQTGNQPEGGHTG